MNRVSFADADLADCGVSCASYSVDSVRFIGWIRKKKKSSESSTCDSRWCFICQNCVVFGSVTLLYVFIFHFWCIGVLTIPFIVVMGAHILIVFGEWLPLVLSISHFCHCLCLTQTFMFTTLIVSDFQTHRHCVRHLSFCVLLCASARGCASPSSRPSHLCCRPSLPSESSSSPCSFACSPSLSLCFLCVCDGRLLVTVSAHR